MLPLDVPEEQLLTLAPPRTVRATDQVTSVQAHVKPQLVPHHLLAALRALAAPVCVEPLVHPQQVAAPEALVADAAAELGGYLYDVNTERRGRLPKM